MSTPIDLPWVPDDDTYKRLQGHQPRIRGIGLSILTASLLTAALPLIVIGLAAPYANSAAELMFTEFPVSSVGTILIGLGLLHLSIAPLLIALRYEHVALSSPTPGLHRPKPSSGSYGSCGRRGGQALSLGVASH